MTDGVATLVGDEKRCLQNKLTGRWRIQSWRNTTKFQVDETLEDAENWLLEGLEVRQDFQERNFHWGRFWPELLLDCWIVLIRSVLTINRENIPGRKFGEEGEEEKEVEEEEKRWKVFLHKTPDKRKIMHEIDFLFLSFLISYPLLFFSSFLFSLSSVLCRLFTFLFHC